MAGGLSAAECAAAVGVVVAALTFVFGVIKIRPRRSDIKGWNSNGKFVLKTDFDIAHSELVHDVKDIRETQVKQGEILARVDERTKMLAKKNGIVEK